MNLVLITFVVLGVAVIPIQRAESAKILFLFGLGSRSHRAAIQPLGEKLAQRNHQVTFVSPIVPEKPHPGIREVRTGGASEAIIKANEDGGVIAVEARIKYRNFDPLYTNTKNSVFQLFYGTSKDLAENPRFHELLETETFDLLIADFTIKEIGHAWAHKANTKLIMSDCGGVQYIVDYDAYGLSPENSWHPDLLTDNVWWPDHWAWTYNSLRWYWVYVRDYLPKYDKLIRENIGPGIPPVLDLFQDVDLIFINEHFSFGYPRALPPYVVPVGGLHLRESNGTLPAKLQAFIDQSPSKSFVYISFGSIIQVSKAPPEFKRSLFEAVSTFPELAFFWKWEGEIPKDLPKNVMAVQWFPQQDVLAHPKCRGFVTQGGAMSYQQSVFHGVPTVIIPVWYDQGAMARMAVHHKIGIHLELADVTKESFREAIFQILNNKTYVRNAKLLAKRTKTRPAQQVDTAVWWVEYVLAHDTDHLKSPAIRQTWWQRRLLDVWALLFTAIALLLFILVKILGAILGMFVGNPNGLSRTGKAKLN